MGWLTLTVAVAGLTTTVATGAGMTLTAEEPDTVPNVAETFAEPTARPVTSPFASTVAAAGALETHVNGIPEIVALAASRATAVSCRV